MSPHSGKVRRAGMPQVMKAEIGESGLLNSFVPMLAKLEGLASLVWLMGTAVLAIDRSCQACSWVIMLSVKRQHTGFTILGLVDVGTPAVKSISAHFSRISSPLPCAGGDCHRHQQIQQRPVTGSCRHSGVPFSHHHLTSGYGHGVPAAP